MSLPLSKGQKMDKQVVLAMMAASSREERKAGFTGYVQPPEGSRAFCEQLVDDGLAEESDKHVGWYRPTEAGYRMINQAVITAH